MDKNKFKSLRKAWRFIWYEDSMASWLVNVILAFILIKFIVYPGLGFILSTSHPVVAVVSGSMEHYSVPVCVKRDVNGCNLYASSQYEICGNTVGSIGSLSSDEFWSLCGKWYEKNNITKEKFETFAFRNGFNTGDIMILYGKKPKDIKTGDVIVFWSKRQDPIIHRVIQADSSNNYSFQTKGDHNAYQIQDDSLNEKSVGEKQLIGNAVIRVPYLGYIKIWFVDLLKLVW